MDRGPDVWGKLRTTHTDVHDALERGYLINLSQGDNRLDLDVGGLPSNPTDCHTPA
jgi:hypothetical protein